MVHKLLAYQGSRSLVTVKLSTSTTYSLPYISMSQALEFMVTQAITSRYQDIYALCTTFMCLLNKITAYQGLHHILLTYLFALTSHNLLISHHSAQFILLIHHDIVYLPVQQPKCIAIAIHIHQSINSSIIASGLELIMPG